MIPHQEGVVPMGESSNAPGIDPGLALGVAATAPVLRTPLSPTETHSGRHSGAPASEENVAVPQSAGRHRSRTQDTKASTYGSGDGFEETVDELTDIHYEGMLGHVDERQKHLRLNLIRQNIDLDSTDVWEAMRQNKASEARANIASMLAVDGASRQADVFGNIAAGIKDDLYGGHGREDSVINMGDPSLAELVITSPEQMEKAEATVALQVQNGIYKFVRWGVATQLLGVLHDLDTLSDSHEGFDTTKAGLDNAVNLCISALAAINLDNQTKPNYPYAKPERAAQARHAQEALRIAAHTVARIDLRNEIARTAKQAS